MFVAGGVLCLWHSFHTVDCAVKVIKKGDTSIRLSVGIGEGGGGRDQRGGGGVRSARKFGMRERAGRSESEIDVKMSNDLFLLLL